jgi:hypothetical protein
VRVHAMSRAQVSKGGYAARVHGMMAEARSRAERSLVATRHARWSGLVRRLARSSAPVRRPGRSNATERRPVRWSVVHLRSEAPAVAAAGRVVEEAVVGGGGKPHQICARSFSGLTIGSPCLQLNA